MMVAQQTSLWCYFSEHFEGKIKGAFFGNDVCAKNQVLLQKKREAEKKERIGVNASRCTVVVGPFGQVKVHGIDSLSSAWC